MVRIQSPTSLRYWGWEEIATTELVRSTGKNRSMPARGVPLSAPNMACSSGINSATEARCRPNTATDMPLSQSTSKVSMVSW
ncbi:hypothetical protein PFL603g_00615 [Pseudomonas fluorescens]|uniref:Uncharacterized protein n=1 Tax=Pseudomonas fluorescens TaxID=294 RepID=A0A109LA69_PSEFL|nr:hypothetical protein PFL603g_00615 [Pseudomonas fluorescens]